MTFCPDCEQEIDGDFVVHREQEHPPTLKVIAPVGIGSKEAFGYQQEE